MKKPFNRFIILFAVFFGIFIAHIINFLLMLNGIKDDTDLFSSAVIALIFFIVTVSTFVLSLDKRSISVHVSSLSTKEIFFSETLIQILAIIVFGSFIIVNSFFIKLNDILFIIFITLCFEFILYIVLSQVFICKNNERIWFIFRNNTVKVISRKVLKDYTLIKQKVSLDDIEFNDADLTIKIKNTEYILKIKTRDQFDNYKSQIKHLFK